MQHGADINAADGCGQKSDGRQLTEAAADAGGNIEGLEAMLLRQLNQVALFMVGRGDNVPCPVIAAGLLQGGGENQILAHGFGSRAGLGDDIEAGGLDIDYVKQRCHTFRVNIIFYIKARTAALVGRKLVVMQMIQRLLNGDGA